MNNDCPDKGRRDFLKKSMEGLAAAGLIAAGLGGFPKKAEATGGKLGFTDPRPSPWFTAEPGNAVRCRLCPRECLISPGRRGECRVRENRNGKGYTLAYGNPALVQIDPVERKPFYHVKPGIRALSVSTAGCPLSCRFCEVWDMALVNPEEVYAYSLSPEALVRHALSAEVDAISYAFGEPVAFYEYMSDICDAAKHAGLLNLMHSSGYILPAPLKELAGKLDAANIDLKSFDPAFYRNIVGGELAPVLKTATLLKEKGIHLEITTIVIPTLNDDSKQISALVRWIVRELGSDTPLHFARFYPLYRLSNLPPTPVASLDRARKIAMDAGLKYVYVSKVPGHEGEDTLCPECGNRIIRRMGFFVEQIEISRGKCNYCGTAIAGLW